MASAKKRKAITLETKVDIIKAVGKGQKQSELCHEYSLSKSTIGTILSSKDKLMEAFEQNTFKSDRKKVRHSDFKHLEEALSTWYRQLRAKNVPLNGPIMIEKATKFAADMNLQNFKASQGWFDNLKKRNNISFQVMAGECESVQESLVDSWIKDVLPALTENWNPRDAYNCDESGLFFRMLPNKS